MRTKTKKLDVGGYELPTVVRIPNALEYAELLDRYAACEQKEHINVARMEYFLDALCDYCVEPSRSREDWLEAPVEEIYTVGGFILEPPESKKKTGTAGGS